MGVLRIVPRAAEPGRLTPTRGTEVLTAGGQPVPGVTKIELVAEANGVWMARLHCFVAIDGELIAQVMPPEAEPAAIARLEAKLDALLDALAGEDDEEERRFDLDGNPLAGERDQAEAL